MKKLSFRLTLSKKRALLGYAFTLPFAVGFAVFFLYPLVQSIIFSFNELRIVPTGYQLESVGWDNYYHSLFVDPDFRRLFVETLIRLLTDIPTILIFSFFAANLLNQKFKGRALARVIFFLPVILSAEIILQVQQADYMQQAMTLSQEGMFSIQELDAFLRTLKLPPFLIDFIVNAINHVPEIIRASGIQILIFLAALQSIPASLYEAADMEGATGWENFWKITFPLISPMLLVNVVYTIIDMFTSPTNELLVLIKKTAWGGAGFGVSVAMSWMFFAAIIILLIICIRLVGQMVHYEQ